MTTLSAPDRAVGDFFGSSIALGTDAVFIGAMHRDDGATIDAGII